ncbi:hypothetical protein MMC20_003680 [Loxospora ochrophaea]|nr:hypothetical protein [Loxospora ochrophaea]
MDDSPKNKACDLLLQGVLSKEAAELLSCLTNSSDFVEEQNFTQLHKIVLGLSSLDLEKEVQLHPDEVDATDALGRTPLMYASVRGDERSVAILLSYNANPNLVGLRNSGPLMYAAAQSHAVCVSLLLEAGANTDPTLFGLRMQRGSPLNCAARLSSNTLVLKTLLDFGADIESCGAEGRTSLLHAARNNNVDFAMLLLEYGAKINANSITSQTPLTAAITHNSHNVLQLLLHRWQEYSTCPRLKGPNLLQVAASYADLETMKILTCMDHFALSYDKNYANADFTTRLRNRPGVSEELINAFTDLLSTINSCPQTEMEEELVEAGLLHRQDSDSDQFNDVKEYHDDE